MTVNAQSNVLNSILLCLVAGMFDKGSSLAILHPVSQGTRWKLRKQSDHFRRDGARNKGLINVRAPDLTTVRHSILQRGMDQALLVSSIR